MMSDQAFQQLFEEAQQGDGFAITLLGLQLINYQTNVEVGKELIFAAADNKNVLWAKSLKSYMCSHQQWQLPLQNNITLDNYALVQFCKYIDKNNLWAIAILGHMYYHGISVPCDREQGKMLLSCATCNTSVTRRNLWAKELIQEYGITETTNLVERMLLLADFTEKFKAIKFQ